MIKPVRNNVLVKCFQGEAVSENGIVVPEAYRGESNRVEIVS